MLHRWAMLITVATIGLVLGGCTKCGPIWDDWTHGPKSCKSDWY